MGLSRFLFKGATATRGTYWFLVPYVEKYGRSEVFKGLYKQFDFDVSVSLDTYGSVLFKDLGTLWHLPLHMPKMPEAIALVAASRGMLERGLEGGDLRSRRAGRGHRKLTPRTDTPSQTPAWRLLSISDARDCTLYWISGH